MVYLAAILAVCTVATASYFGYLLRKLAEDAQAERADLLNRLMARDFSEYKALSTAAPTAEIQPFLSDEDEAQLEEQWHGQL